MLVANGRADKLECCGWDFFAGPNQNELLRFVVLSQFINCNPDRRTSRVYVTPNVANAVHFQTGDVEYVDRVIENVFVDSHAFTPSRLRFAGVSSMTRTRRMSAVGFLHFTKHRFLSDANVEATHANPPASTPTNPRRISIFTFRPAFFFTFLPIRHLTFRLFLRLANHVLYGFADCL